MPVRRAQDPAERGDHDHALTIDRRRALLGGLLALLLAGAAFAVIGQVAHFGRLRTAIGQGHKLWLLACAGGQLLSYLGYLLAYRDAARATGGPQFGLWATVRIVIFGQGASVLGASVGGLAVDFWALRRTGTNKHTAARRVLALGTLEWTVLSVYACAAAVVVLIAGLRAPAAMAIAWLAAVPACVLGALWFTAPSRVSEWINPRPGSSPRGLARPFAAARERARVALADAVAGVVLVRHLLSHPLRYRAGALGYPLYWVGDMLILYASIRVFGPSPNLITLVLAYASSYVISALPLPVGGAGGIEASMALAIHAVGVPLAPALLGVFVYRVVTFWLPVLPALALLPHLRGLHRELASVPHTEPDPDEGVPFRPADDVRTRAGVRTLTSPLAARRARRGSG